MDENEYKFFDAIEEFSEMLEQEIEAMRVFLEGMIPLSDFDDVPLPKSIQCFLEGL